jgi:hypothetical protein
MDYNLGNDEHGERDQESSTRLDVVQERDLDDSAPGVPLKRGQQQERKPCDYGENERFTMQPLQIVSRKMGAAA